MKIVAVGECTTDRFLERGADRVGGISLNFAIQCRRSGASRVALVSCTGTDAAGALIRAKLARDDVDAVRLHTRPGVTATQAIRLGPGGERFFPPGGYQAAVLADFHLSPADLAFVATFDVVAVPYFRELAHVTRPALDAAASGARRVVDVLDGADLGAKLEGLDSLLDGADLVFLSGAEATAERLLPTSRNTRTLIVVTHGAAGSSALVGGRRISAPAVIVPPVEQIDTTGCGDAFQAAFTVEYFARGDVPAALLAGAARAAEAIRHLGATGE